MSIAKPFTFVANTYAKASEVNANFDTVYSQVNSNISAISQNAVDIDNLENNKADINGSSSQRFGVADAVTDSDAINKRTLRASIANSIDYISGFTITKDSGNPENTIIVSAGSCYDSSKTVVLNKSLDTTKTNSNQGAGATYYVYIIGSSSGASTDILISESGTVPGLPEGYTLYRQIGRYTTDSNNKIDIIKSYGIPSNTGILTSADNVMPDMSKRVSVSSGDKAPAPGYVFMLIKSTGNDPLHHVYVNGVEIYKFSRGGDYGGGKYQSYYFAIAQGDTITWSGNQMDVSVAQFVYCKGW